MTAGNTTIYTGIRPKLDHINNNSKLPDYILRTDYLDVYCDDIEIYDPTGRITSVFTAYWRLEGTTNGRASLIPGQWVRTQFRGTDAHWNGSLAALLMSPQYDSRPWGGSGAYVKIKGLKVRFVRGLS